MGRVADWGEGERDRERERKREKGEGGRIEREILRIELKGKSKKNQYKKAKELNSTK